MIGLFNNNNKRALKILAKSPIVANIRLCIYEVFHFFWTSLWKKNES